MLALRRVGISALRNKNASTRTESIKEFFAKKEKKAEWAKVPKEMLKFPLKPLPPSDKPSGYLEPLGGTEHLPFQFERTASKQLPVYSDLKNGGTRRLTVVRKYTGDVEELKAELRRLLGNNPDIKIEEKTARLYITGHHVGKIKRWLRMLGF